MGTASFPGNPGGHRHLHGVVQRLDVSLQLAQRALEPSQPAAAGGDGGGQGGRICRGVGGHAGQPRACPAPADGVVLRAFKASMPVGLMERGSGMGGRGCRLAARRVEPEQRRRRLAGLGAVARAAHVGVPCCSRLLILPGAVCCAAGGPCAKPRYRTLAFWVHAASPAHLTVDRMLQQVWRSGPTPLNLVLPTCHVRV